LIDDELRNELIEAGASIVGFAEVHERILRPEIEHLDRAVSIGVSRNLNDGTVELLSELKRLTAAFLKSRGYKFLAIPPVSRGEKKTFISRLYPLFTHRIAATSAGLGWIGRNGLLINPEYGPRLSFTTVLTDAPLRPGSPFTKCMCGNCRMCVEHCPAGALTGNDWSRDDPYIELVDLRKCRGYKEKSRMLNGKPNCGLCINICPHGRKKIRNDTKAVEGMGVKKRERMAGCSE
jgi:epoxyqueuosine reductase QueG